MSIGTKIYMYLIQNNISQTWLSENARIALPKLNASLRNKRRITVDEYERIINALSVDANTFIDSK